MKKAIKLFGLLFMVCLFAPMTSCGDDDDDEPSAVVGKVEILNNSKYSLENFFVNFTNDHGEIITREQKGTIKPKERVYVDIPIGATYYYMGFRDSGYTFFSVDYAVSVRNQVLTDQIVGNWSTN